MSALHRVICPESNDVGRSTCFTRDVTAVHHMLEESKFEWWDADNHVRPLVEFLARAVQSPLNGNGNVRVLFDVRHCILTPAVCLALYVLACFETVHIAS